MTKYYENGHVQTLTEYINNQKSGSEYTNFMSGETVSIVRYKSNLKQGTAEHFHINGNLWCKYIYVND